MEGRSMSDEMECMCLECGISSHFPAIDLSFDDFPGFAGKRFVTNLSCPQCGGALFVVGRVGEEPLYRTG